MKLNVNGNSMFPYLQDNELVKVEPVGAEQPRKGDIVVFERNGQLIAHRLIKKKDNHYITKGDFCLKRDEPFSSDLLIGQITAIFRGDKVIVLNRFKHRLAGILLVRLEHVLPWIIRILRKLRIINFSTENFNN